MTKAPVGAPWAPAKYEVYDLGAIQALEAGLAEPHQQKRALKWIIESVCGTYEMSFSPDNERWTSFAEGKRYCGNQILKAMKLNIGALKERE